MSSRRRQRTAEAAPRRVARRPRAAVGGTAGAEGGAFAALRLDGGALLAGSGLLGIGVVMSYSSTAPLALDRLLPPLFVEHMAALALGIALAMAALLTPLRAVRALALPGWCLAVAMLAATDVLGVEVNGAQRWLPVPGLGIRFQPVEIAAVAIVAVPVALLVRQPDFGNAVLLCTLAGIVMIAAGTPIRRLWAPGLLAAVAIAGYIATHEYAMRRVIGFLDPWKDPLGVGFQLVQSFVAFGKGGLHPRADRRGAGAGGRPPRARVLRGPVGGRHAYRAPVEGPLRTARRARDDRAAHRARGHQCRGRDGSRAHQGAHAAVPVARRHVAGDVRGSPGSAGGR